MTFKNELAWILRRRVLPKPARKKLSEFNAGPVVVAGLFTTANGIGRTARIHFHALRAAGIECEAIDLSPFFQVSDMSSELNFLEKIEKEQKGTLIICLNPVEAEAALYSTILRNARGWRIIGNWVWELPNAPDRWLFRSHRFSEIWVPSEFVREALSKINKPSIKIVPLCLPENKYTALKAKIEKPGSALNFLIAADGWSSYERKNVLGSVRAYLKAFPKACENHLIVKCRNLSSQSIFETELKSQIGSRSDISVNSKTVSDQEMNEIIGRSDIVISLHRSEGYGLVLAEAMRQGKIVVATVGSGNLQFMNAENSILVEYKLVPVEDPFGIYSLRDNEVWADPDIDHAAVEIKMIADDPVRRNEVGNRAKSALAEAHDPRILKEALLF